MDSNTEKLSLCSNEELLHLAEEALREGRDPSLAFQCASLLQKRGVPGGFNILGEIDRRGLGQEVNLGRAQFYFTKSAMLGDPKGQEALGDLLTERESVKGELRRALTWYEAAASNGNGAACIKLGRLYEKGAGVRKDLEEAVFWYGKAVAAGAFEASADEARVRAALASVSPETARIPYYVDFVFCIDISESMDKHLDHIKEVLKNIPPDLEQIFSNHGRSIEVFRGKLILFDDYCFSGEKAMSETGFFDLHKEKESFYNAVNAIETGHNPGLFRSGFEALSSAINAQWYTEHDKNRRIIVLFTDGQPRELGRTCPSYPADMVKSFEDLHEAWQQMVASPYYPMLLLLAPDCPEWKQIAFTWDNTMLLPGNAGDTLEGDMYRTILHAIDDPP